MVYKRFENYTSIVSNQSQSQPQNQGWSVSCHRKW